MIHHNGWRSPSVPSQQANASTTSTLPSSLSEDQSLAFVVAALAALPASERNLLVQFFNLWLVLEGEQRAALIRLLMPEPTNREIARLAGVSAGQLSRPGFYREVRRIQKAAQNGKLPPRGFQDDEGTIEAWA